MKGDLKHRIYLYVVVILIAFLAIPQNINKPLFIQNSSALTREFQENFTILPDKHQELQVVFSGGEELELIFSFEVKQNLLIDVWFVDYTNYVRLTDGHDFVFFIDGSGQEIRQAEKVVTVTLYGTYELVFANYNNVSVDVYLTYDVNVYPLEEDTTTDDTEDDTSTPYWKEPYFMLPLGLIIGIIAGIFLTKISRKPGKEKPKTKAKPSKKKKHKVKKEKTEGAKKPSPEKIKFQKSKKVKPKAIEKVPSKEVGEPKAAEKPKAEGKAPSPSFCGHCGKPAETPFCPFCGKETRVV